MRILTKTIILLLIPLVIGVGSAYAVSVIYPEDGGTGTNTLPTVDQLLVGVADGLYAPSSSLGQTVRLTDINTTDLDVSGVFTFGGEVAAGGLDLNANPLIMDLDGDTQMIADVDDTIDLTFQQRRVPTNLQERLLMPETIISQLLAQFRVKLSK